MLYEAVAAFRSASEVYNRSAAPAEWANLQYNLGVALSLLGLSGDRSQLPAALTAARNALAGFEAIGEQQSADQARRLVAILEAQ